MPNSYQPGQRREMYGQNHKIGDERFAWVQCEAGKFIILVGEDKGSGSDVVLYHPRAGRIPDLAINLTNLTRAELDGLRGIFDSAFEWAETVVDRRDKEAEDAWNAGDDSHSRNYRPVPTVVYRKRPEPQHGQGVHDGPDAVPDERGDGEPGRVRGAGAELAEPVQGEGGTEDHPASSD